METCNEKRVLETIETSSFDESNQAQINIRPTQYEHLQKCMEPDSSPIAADSSREQESSQIVKRPRNSFIIWSMEMRGQLNDQYPDTKLTDISRLLGQKWREMNQSQRQPYEQRAQEERASFSHQHPGFKFRTRQRKRRHFQKSVYKYKCSPLDSRNACESTSSPPEDIEPINNREFQLQSSGNDVINSTNQSKCVGRSNSIYSQAITAILKQNRSDLVCKNYLEKKHYKNAANNKKYSKTPSTKCKNTAPTNFSSADSKTPSSIDMNGCVRKQLNHNAIRPESRPHPENVSNKTSCFREKNRLRFDSKSAHSTDMQPTSDGGGIFSVAAVLTWYLNEDFYTI